MVLAKCSKTSVATPIAGVPHLGHIGIMLIFSYSANVSVHRRRTLCAVRCDALFEHVFMAVLVHVPNCFRVAVEPLFCPVTQRSFSFRTSAVTGGALCATYGATPCSARCFARGSLCFKITILLSGFLFRNSLVSFSLTPHA